MMQKKLLKSRRSFLKSGLLICGAALAGAGVNYAVNPGNRIIARQLISYLQYHHLADMIGASFIAYEKTLQTTSLQQLIELILDQAGLSRQDMSLFSSIDQLAIFHRQVREDFISENIVRVDGWVLSTTEARLCALLHRYHHPLS